MLMVKPVPPLPSHNSGKDLTERFSEHFINKITNLRENLVKCPSPSQAEINTKSCTSFFLWIQWSQCGNRTHCHWKVTLQVMSLQPYANQDSEILPEWTAASCYYTC